MFACEKGRTQMVQRLLLHPQCDVTLRDNVSTHVQAVFAPSCVCEVVLSVLLLEFRTASLSR